MALENLSHLDRRHLLEAVGAYVRHQGEREWDALDDALRPLSDDPKERYEIYLAARPEYLESLSDAERAELAALPGPKVVTTAIPAWERAAELMETGAAAAL